MAELITAEDTKDTESEDSPSPFSSPINGEEINMKIKLT